MEKNFHKSKGTGPYCSRYHSANSNYSVDNQTPGTIRTIYHTSDCNIYKSSESSVQIFSDNNCIGPTSPRGHFCELDIKSRKDRKKTAAEFVPLQTITEDFKFLAMPSRVVHNKGMFRKQIHDEYNKPVKERSSEVLCLANLLKEGGSSSHDSNTYVSEIVEKLLEKKHKEIEAAKEMKDKKKSRKHKVRSRDRSNSKSAKVRDVPASSSSFFNSNFINNKEVTKNFGDLVNAKTMYYANLPNKPTNDTKSTDKEPVKLGKEENASEPFKDKRKQNIDCFRINDEAPPPMTALQKSQVLEKIDSKLGKIIINRIENENALNASSANSESTVAQKNKNQTEVFIDVFGYTAKDTSYRRIHNNSPISDATFDENVDREKFVKPNHKKKRKKKHVNSRMASSEEDNEELKKKEKGPKDDEEGKADVVEETQIPKKKSHSKRKHHKRNEDSISPANEIDAERKSNHSMRAKNEEEKHHRHKPRPDAEAKEETERKKAKEESGCLEQGDFNAETGHKKHKREKSRKRKTAESSVVKLFVAERMIPSVSHTIIVDDESILKPHASSKRKKSKKPQSRSSSKKSKSQPRKENFDSYTTLKSGNKCSADKKRSKSPLGKEKKHRNRSHSKHEDNEPKSRTIFNDLFPKHSNDNLDGRSSSDEKRKHRDRSKSSKAGKVKKEKKHKYREKIEPAELSEKYTKKESHMTTTKTSEMPSTTDITWEENNFSYFTNEISFTEDTLSHHGDRTSVTTLIFNCQKKNWKRSKSCLAKQNKDSVVKDDKKMKVSKSQVFSSSEVSVHKRLVRRKRSKSYVLKDHHKVKKGAKQNESESKEKLCEELQKLTAFQHINPLRKRFKVVPKILHEKSKCEVTAPSPVEQAAKISVPTLTNHRLKPHICTEEEREAILNLPICKSDYQNSTTKTNSSFSENSKVEETIYEENEVENTHKSFYRMKKGNVQSDAMSSDDTYMKIKDKKKKRLTKKTVYRKEVSFSHLNVTPVCDIYKKNIKLSVPQRLLSPDIAEATKIERIHSVLARTRDFTFDNKMGYLRGKQENSYTDSKISEKSFDDTDFSLETRLSERKLSTFHMILGEKILEVSTKAIGHDGKTIAGFTVSGSEPPKLLKYGSRSFDKSSILAKTCKLHMTFLQPIEIVEGTSFRNKKSFLMHSAPAAHPDDRKDIKENAKIEKQDQTSEPFKALCPPFTPAKPSIPKLKKPTSLGRRWKRSTSFKSSSFRKNDLSFKYLWNPEITNLKTNFKTISTTTTKTHTSPTMTTLPCQIVDKNDINKERTCTKNKGTVVSEKLKYKPKITRNQQKQDYKNRNRINSTLKLLESTLQIIKEESQSTDTSSCYKNCKSKSKVSLEIKETQTDLRTEDITKMKEVINYLYSTIDMKKEDCKPMEVKTDEKAATVDSSSTETSSYCEQFKNIVKNIKPKFIHMRKPTSSAALLKRTVSDTSHLHGTDVDKQQAEVKSKKFDSLSSEERSSSHSDSKSKPSRIPKKVLKQRPKSADILSKGYFERYRFTKELIESKKKDKADAMCQQVEAEVFKSTSSTSASSSPVMSIKGTCSVEVQCSPSLTITTDSLIKRSDDKISTASNTVIIKEDESRSVVGSNDTKRYTHEFLRRKAELKSKASANEQTQTKQYEDKSLQTENKIIEHASQQTLNVEDEPKQIVDGKEKKEAPLIEITSNSLENSYNKAIIDKKPSLSKQDFKKAIKKVSSKTTSKFERLKRAFTGKEDKFINSDFMAYNVSEKQDSKKTFDKKQPVEVDYINFIKLERHLEQLLGLYPSIFKAIRAQIDDTTIRNIDKKLKYENPELFTSKSTLATTVDTITEYKNIESYNKLPHFSDTNISRQCSSCSRCFNFGQKQYVIERFIKSHNFAKQCIQEQSDLTQSKRRPTRDDEKTRKVYRKKIERTKGNPKNLYTDTTSSTRLNGMEQCNASKQIRKGRRPKTMNKKKNVRVCEEGACDSITSVYSNEKGFLSSCSSASLCDRWSLASPLYSRTTPSLDVTSLGGENLNASKSSRSLTVCNKKMPVAEKLKSQSLIEVSTHKTVNRKRTLERLLDGNRKQNVDELIQCLADETPPSILLLSVSSSCTVFTSPSKFLAKVERKLEFDNNLPKQIDVVTPNTGAGKSKHSHAEVEEGSFGKEKKIDEQSYHSILFADNQSLVASSVANDGEKKKPFYFHKKKDSNSDFLDSLEVDAPGVKRVKNVEDEDLGNFSADSLETLITPAKSFNCDMLLTEQSHVQPTNQTYLVYTNTIEYDKDSKRGEKPKHPNKPPKPDSKTLQAGVPGTSVVKRTCEDTSNTLISESGYESTKSKRTVSIRNFFKKGGSLLDIFRNTSKGIHKVQKVEPKGPDSVNLTSFSNLWMKGNDVPSEEKKDAAVQITKQQLEDNVNLEETNKVYWFNINKQDGEKKTQKSDKKLTTFDERSVSKKEKKAEQKQKGPGSCKLSRKCSCSDSMKSFKKQMDECHAYAEKVVLESQLRKEGYYKQYKDFKEIPLELLIGKKMPLSSKYRKQESSYVQATAPSKPTFAQTCSRHKDSVSCSSSQCPKSSDFFSDTYESEEDESNKPKTYTADELIILKSGGTLKQLRAITGEKPVEDNYPRDSRNTKRQESKPDSPSTFTPKQGGRSSSTRPVTPIHVYRPSSPKTSMTKRASRINSPKISTPKQGDRFTSPKTSATKQGSRVSSPKASTPKQEGRSKSPNASTPKRSKHNIDSIHKLVTPKQSTHKVFEKAHRGRKSPVESQSKFYDDEASETQHNLQDLSAKQNRKLKMSQKKIEIEDLPARQNEISHIHQKEVTEVYKNKKPRSRSQPHTRSRSRSKSSTRTALADNEENCFCDKPLPAKPKIEPAEEKTSTEDKEVILPEIEEKPQPLEVEIPGGFLSSSSESIIVASNYEDSLFMRTILNEIVANAAQESARFDSSIYEEELLFSPSPERIGSDPIKVIQSEISDIPEPKSLPEMAALEEKPQPPVEKQSSEDIRKGLTDKEVFDKLLDSFEREETIATRLSKDEDFFKDQVQSMKKESDESIEEEQVQNAQADANDNIYTEDPMGGKHRSTHFWEEKVKTMKAKEENPVKTDDIGTCFSRGFRPDNIALSGDACFSLNKQDKLKFPKGMLTNEESIIDFSERETPLDYLLALGFMVDEASNALKDEDIRSRLLAAITEARVWINKITTTQGTLLYLVAYKSRPKTMRYFLQLVEAIINKRINNAIKLDGFLRVLEQVEEGEIQMINILGADKFEDEENEEKIVRKQLRQLFITVYKIAEREAMLRGKQLTQQAIVLLRILAAKYRAGLHPHLELIARYIGQELLNTETQLEAAMIFLSRLDTAEVKLKEFEAYCDIKCEKKKRNKSPKAIEEPATE